MDEDFALALQMSEDDFHVNSDSDVKLLASDKKNLSIVDSSWEMIDPVPDIRELFVQFNAAYFDGLLAGVEVKWSSRMTLCAGLCCYEGRGGLCSVKLSEPLLKLRPRSDLVNTLLHEMIHALLFITDNNKDHDGHGEEFHKHMYRINKETGSNITVYHTFHDEVNNYRQHWWRCDGPCVKRPPFYGIVRRAMNRAPSARDPWFKDHERKCGGAFIKIKEPDKSLKKNTKKKKEDKTSSSSNSNFSNTNSKNNNTKSITDFFNKNTDQKTDSINSHSGILKKNQSTGSNVKNFRDIDAKSKTPSDVPDSTIFSGSSKSASSDIHGFKMSANKKPETRIDLFSGKGHKVIGSSATISSKKLDSNTSSTKKTDSNTCSNKEAFLKKIEAKMSSSSNSAVSIKRKLQNENASIFKRTTKESETSSVKLNKKSRLSGELLGGTQNNERYKNDDSKPLSNIDALTRHHGTDDNESETSFNTKKSSSRVMNVLLNDATKDNPTSLISGSSRNVIVLNDSSDNLAYTDTLLVECPACPAKMPQYELNRHLDICLA